MRGNFETRLRLPEQENRNERGNGTVRNQQSQNREDARRNEEFIRNHFEEFVNRKNMYIGEVNFAPSFVDHGADVPRGLPPGPEGAIQYVGTALKKVPDLSVTIEDMIAEDDRVVVRNHWTGTDAASKQRLEFSGIVIWRIANRQIIERWAYLETPHPARG